MKNLDLIIDECQEDISGLPKELIQTYKKMGMKELTLSTYQKLEDHVQFAYYHFAGPKQTVEEIRECLCKTLLDVHQQDQKQGLLCTLEDRLIRIENYRKHYQHKLF